VGIASMAGKEGWPGVSTYAAAKGGVIAYTRSLAHELARSRAMVNAVAPEVAATGSFSQMTPSTSSR
jgi:NAD(P)-dependent dehydrogenase (short-subunit alcohol dehydrogenase family)